MNLQKQPNRWSCIATSFAICLDIPVDDIISELGHDGSSLLDGEQRRGFHIQELILYSYRKGYYAIPFETNPELINEKGESFFIDINRYYINYNYDVEQIMENNIGVLLGKTLKNKLHAVAWDGRMIYDPNGTIYTLRYVDQSLNFLIETFYLIGKIC